MDIQQQETDFVPITITLHTREEALDFLAVIGHVSNDGPGIRNPSVMCSKLCELLELDDLTVAPIFERIEGELSWK